ncbi:MAG: hypothetical protein ACRD38_11535 [Nitrososphaerales archaeon]
MGTDRKERLYSIGLASLLVTAFVLTQPMAYSQEVENEDVSIEGIPAFEDCDDQFLVDVSMDTVKNGSVILTTHSEKEIFECLTVQGNIEILVEVTVVAQIYENITTKDTIAKQVEVITCIRDPSQAKTYGCETDIPDTIPTPVVHCVSDDIRKNQNSINKGKTVKTIEAQKILYLCDLDGFERDVNNVDQPLLCAIPKHKQSPGTDPTCFDPDKKVDEIIFTETWKDLSKLPNPIVKTSFESLRCVIKIDTATVESCKFTSLGGS